MSDKFDHEHKTALAYMDRAEKTLLSARRALEYAHNSHLTHGEQNGLIGFASHDVLEVIMDLQKARAEIQGIIKRAETDASELLFE